MLKNIYRLDMIPDKVKPLIMVSQYDTAREIQIDLFMDGVEYEPSEVSILLGEEEITPTVSGNSVNFDVTLDMTMDAGITEGEVVADGMGSLNFFFVVDSTPEPVPPTAQVDLIESNKALSILLGMDVNVDNPKEALSIIKGD